MTRRIAKRIVAMIMVVCCIAGMAVGVSATMPYYVQSVGFVSNGSRYTSKQDKSEVSTYYTVKLSSCYFDGGVSWPSGKYIETTMTNTAGTVIGTKIYQYSTTYGSTSNANYNSTWQNITGQKNVMLRLMTNTGKNGTATVKWSPGYYASLP